MTDHLKRIQRAIDFIEDNLCEELPTDQIAKVAAFSMWHFQKIFSSVVGDNVKEYVRKRRLTSAMRDLATTERRILDIALDYQFDSQEAFSRAFKSHFDRTPGECRNLGIKAVPSLSKPKVTFDYLDHLYGGMTMKPKFVTTKEMNVIGMSTQFISILSPDKNNHLLLPKLWDAYLKRSWEIKHKQGSTHVGLCEAIPNAAIKRHPDEFFYMAGTEVNHIGTIPLGMVAKSVPAGRYAVFTHKGKLDKLDYTMNFIFESWLPKSGEELREAPDLEIYDDRFDPDSDKSEMDIYIPVK